MKNFVKFLNVNYVSETKMWFAMFSQLVMLLLYITVFWPAAVIYGVSMITVWVMQIRRFNEGIRERRETYSVTGTEIND